MQYALLNQSDNIPVFIIFGIIGAVALAGVVYSLFKILRKPEKRGKTSWEKQAAELAESHSADELYDLALRCGDSTSPDYDLFLSRELMERAAQKGNAKAQLACGIRFQHDKNDVAVDWLKKAAAQGVEEAYERLGGIYYFGEDLGEPKIAENPEEAVKWYSPIAEKGNVEAQKLLALCYSLKLEDKDMELKWLLKASESGDTEAINSLCLFYGAEGEEEKQMEWRKKLAEKGDAESQYELGTLYEFAEAPDLAQAVRWYKKSAENGYSSAKVKLGKLYLIGEGVEKNEKLALELFGSESAAGNDWATYNLGMCYLDGTAVEKDERKAAELFGKSDCFLSKYQLALCYLDGVGVDVDEKKAFRLLMEANNDIDDSEVCGKLSECYYYGKGTPVDRDKAEEFRRKAEKLRKEENGEEEYD